MVSRNFNIVWQSAFNNQDNQKSVPKPAGPLNTDLIKSILKQGTAFQNRVIVIMLPCTIIKDDNLLANFAENIHLLSSCGAKLFIIHDYVNLLNETLSSLGLKDSLINGTRITNSKSTKIVEMVLSGYINKMIVSKLCYFECNAVGISGKDANLIRVQKPKIMHQYDINSDVINISLAGEPEIVNTEILLNFEELGIIPVISPISSDVNGRTHLLETYMTASLISSALDADHLVLISEQQICGNQDLKFDDELALLNVLNKVKSDTKISKIIKAALFAIQHSTRMVHFSTIKNKDTLLSALFS